MGKSWSNPHGDIMFSVRVVCDTEGCGNRDLFQGRGRYGSWSSARRGGWFQTPQQKVLCPNCVIHWKSLEPERRKQAVSLGLTNGERKLITELGQGKKEVDGKLGVIARSLITKGLGVVVKEGSNWLDKKSYFKLTVKGLAKLRRI